MKEGLELLYALQLKDDKISDIENIIKEIPQNIGKLENERDGKAEIIEKTKNKLKENINVREKFEKEILQIKETINKYKEQLSKATTNKEYQGFTAEIKFEETKISSIEEKIIEKMLESDEIMDEIRKSEGEFKKIADEYNVKIKDLNKNLEYNKSKLSEEAKSKSELRTKISEKLLKAYDNLLKKKNGKAVSYVETEFCGICNVKIRPQVLSELISTNSIIICESCGRILFVKVNTEKEKQAEKKN